MEQKWEGENILDKTLHFNMIVITIDQSENIIRLRKKLKY